MKVQALQNLMVSIAMKKSMASELQDADFPRVHRTREEQEALTGLYRQTAAERSPNLDVHRLQRTDATGHLQADGGNLLFGKDGQAIVSPHQLPADLAKYGFRLAVAEIFSKDGDEDHIRLRLTWSRNGAEQILTERQKKLTRRYFNNVYWKVFGFLNPEAVSLQGDQSPVRGSIITLNFTGVMNASQVEGNLADVRDLKVIDGDGHIRCDLRRENPVLEWTPSNQSLEEVIDSALADTPARDTRVPRMICPERPSRSQKAT